MATGKKDFYAILGVKKTDSADAIKKAYKKLALQHHPDKAAPEKKKEFEDKFKEINEAYSTLSDETKRREYDSESSSPFGRSGASNFQGGGNFSDVLRDLFRNGSFGGGYDEDDEEEEVEKDLRYELVITFKEAVFGCEKEISIKKNVHCEHCDGTGAENKEFKNCPECGGQGRVKVNQKTPWGLISQVVRCDNCNGQGKIYDKKCKHCDGDGVYASREKVKVKIPAGIDNGQVLRIRNEGNAVKNSAEGDLYLVVQVTPDKVFKRENFDIYIEKEITFSQAALGAEIPIPTLSGEDVKIKIVKGTESGHVLRLKERGIPFLNEPGLNGDQFVKIIVKTPKKLSRAQTKLFEELAELDE